MFEEELGALEAFREFLAGGLLDDAGAGEADEGAGFGDVEVAEHGEAGGDASGGGVGHQGDVGDLGVVEAGQGAQWLAADGSGDALELTGGSSLQNPMYYFRGEAPVAEMARYMPKFIRPGFKLFGGRFLHSYPYEEAYFLPYARQVRAAVDLPLILLGGVSELATVHRAMDEGFEFVAMGRALLREPDLIGRWEAGRTEASLCIHCNKCMPTIYRGTRCVLVPPEGDGTGGAPTTDGA